LIISLLGYGYPIFVSSVSSHSLSPIIRCWDRDDLVRYHDDRLAELI